MYARVGLRVFLGIAAALAFHAASAEEIRDYYAEPGLNPFKDSLNQSFNEHVDPFSGTLQLKYTDISIPGNGGMDINIHRAYTSLQTNSYPIINLSGLGWVMHFGRIVVPQEYGDWICEQPQHSTDTSNNPSLEHPDGGREILVLNGIQNDATLITRSNWKAECTGAPGMLVTAPDGTRYTMDRLTLFQGERSWFTTRIEDLQGNWIAIDYETNAVGVTYISQIRRSEEGSEPVVQYEYEDEDGPGIALSAIVANGQRWEYRYETIPGFMYDHYKQLVEVIRPDGTSWHYAYNGHNDDPDPDDDVIEDGLASYSLQRVTYPHGATIDYTYQYVEFDPASAFRTTAIATKQVSGSEVAGGTWTYQFSPSSEPYDDSYGGQLHYDVTTITAPGAIYRYAHYGKSFRALSDGTQIFIRPSYVGLAARKEILRPNGELIERVGYSWQGRKISNEDFFHGGVFRSWWRDDGTYAPVLAAEFVRRDSDAAGYQHGKYFYDYDAYGNPGRVVETVNLGGYPNRQVTYTYFNDPVKWVIGLPEDELHEGIGEGGSTLGTVERTYDENGKLLYHETFGVGTAYTYNSDGDVETVEDARGNVKRYLDYKRGIPRREEWPESITITRTVNDTGTVASETNGRGYTTSFEYDDLNRLTGIDYPINSDVEVDYASSNGVLARTLTRGAYRQIESINDFGQRVRLERRDTATGEAIFRTSEYDALGREIFTSYPNDTIGIATTYDALGRVERTEHPDGTAVSYGYDNTEVTVTNERGFDTHYRYLVYGGNYAGQMLSSIRAPENVGTHIRRDAMGNVTLVFQGETQADSSLLGYGKTYRYDSRHLLIESFEDEIGTTIYTHDEIGNVVTEQVNEAMPVTFVYDGLNRRKRVEFPDSTPDVITEYDANGNVRRLTKGSSEWVYEYDANDNLLSEVLTVSHPLLPPRGYSISYAVNGMDVVTQMTYPSGLVVDYAPDAFGRATQVGSFASNIDYHPSGQVSAYTLANGITTTIQLNRKRPVTTV